MDKLFDFLIDKKEVVGWYNLHTEEVLECPTMEHISTILKRPEYSEVKYQVDQVDEKEADDMQMFIDSHSEDEHIGWHAWENGKGEYEDLKIKAMVPIFNDGWVRFGYYKPNKSYKYSSLDLRISPYFKNEYQTRFLKLSRDLEIELHYEASIK